ncbi:MAG TPA: protein-L-isoaspartate O-methyltransferase, partial [Flavobacteriales bacterium]|nr:protein-L-isoaspartate O-methyltransferase [Flavobacteriales bacterium]
MVKDSHKQQGNRKKLVAHLREKGIVDEKVLSAIGKVPRHLFLNSAFDQFAYEDRPFSIGAGQTISQPYTVAVQSELLQIKRGLKVLEIGTGSGYQASVLQEMGAKVFSVERIKELFDRTSKLLPKLG